MIRRNVASVPSEQAAAWLEGWARDHRPPSLQLEVVTAATADLFSIAGVFTPLGSERDQIFSVSTGSGTILILRISGPGETRSALEMQNSALIHIAGRPASLPVPRVLRSVHGRHIEYIQHGRDAYAVRLFTFVPGEPVRGKLPSLELLNDMGRTLALLDLALKDLREAPGERFLMWNMLCAPTLRPLIRHVDQRSHRSLVEDAFDRLEARVLAALSSMPAQMIHNDFNPRNVLTVQNAPDRVSGVIDFGDMAVCPRVVDLGVAISRQVGPTNMLQRAREIVRGYCAVLQLKEDEIANLFDVICARLAIRAVIWEWRGRLGDSRFGQDRIGDTYELLAKWRSQGEARVTDDFAAACLEILPAGPQDE